MNTLILTSPNEITQRDKAIDFCNRFISSKSQPKYILGQNVYSQSVQKIISIDGLIDDFSSASQSNGIPIIKSSEVPKMLWY